MMIKKILLFSLIILLFNNCFGDKKTAIGTDFSDTSFVNKSFKKNPMEFSEITDVCSYLSVSQLAKLYNVTEEEILVVNVNKTNKACSFYVKLSDQKFDHILGSVGFYEEKDIDEDGSTWIEKWQLQKNISKSSVWIPNLGKAAYYVAKKRTLFVKFNNYTMSIMAPGSDFNKIEKSKNRDYINIVLQMAKNIPLLK